LQPWRRWRASRSALAENRVCGVVSLKPTFAIRLSRARCSARRLSLVTRPCGAISDPGMIEQGRRPDEVANEPGAGQHIGASRTDDR
jgi:hypothetical protein